MPKRDSRIRVIEHHLRQLEALKGLQPNATPERWRPFSDGLIDLAREALRLAGELEAGRRLDRHQVMHLAALVRRLPELAPRKPSPDEDSHAPDETR